MKFVTHSHRNAEFVFAGMPKYSRDFREACDVLAGISDEDIISEFRRKESGKSLSGALNRLIKGRLVERGWSAESPIFMDDDYGYGGRATKGNGKGKWRLDFAKGSLCAEVAFNHRSDISWNLLKPTLSSELNHVEKAIETEGGMVICATESLKESGGFDGAVGTFEDYVHYLLPMTHILTAPLVIVGLEAPETFYIDVRKENGRNRGHVVRLGG
ncbi:MAG: hypothetical protein IKG18_09300 [Atopobiaceae bacterium]|nr:hypothetical protein [Atopobiaceae bacterium]